MQSAITMQSLYMIPSSKMTPKDDLHLHTKPLKNPIPFIDPSSFTFCTAHTYKQHRSSNRPYIRHMKALYGPFSFRRGERSSSHQCEDKEYGAAHLHRLRNSNGSQEMSLHALHSTTLNPLKLPVRRS